MRVVRLEHINEHTVKVMIKTSDLEERGITFFDLLGNQKKVETFFYSILEEVGLRSEFEGLDTVTFQVVPKSDGLDLYITKGLNVDFTKQIKEDLQSESTPHNGTPLDNIYRYFEQGKDAFKQNQKRQQRAKEEKELNKVLAFDSLEKFITFAQSLTHKEIRDNHLYKHQHVYYWHMNMSNLEESTYFHYQAIEHGGQVAHISEVFLSEHAQLVIEQEAVQMIKKHFK